MRAVLFFLSLFIFTDCFAQPANDEPCNATLLPIIENADGCNPVLYTVTGATYSNVPGTSNCGALPDVWLKFNTPDERMKLRITGSNIYISTYTYSSCSANLTDALPCLDSATLASLMNGNVVFEPGVNQLIRVSSINGSANFSFRICATLLRPAANQRVGINTKLPTANLDVAGVAVFRDTLSVQNTFRLYKGNATNNYVLTSDVNGYANWAPPPGNYWLANGNKIYNSNAGNVGIGTNNPQAKFHVADSNVVFTGPPTIPFSTSFSPPVQGAGSRMMWYPQKAAFRSGAVNGTQWDKNNIGSYSFAVGNNTIAGGEGAFAAGGLSSASGYYSTAFGLGNQALGGGSTAMGNQTIADGAVSVAMGQFTTAKNSFSLVIGTFNDTTSQGSLFEIGNGGDDNARSNALTVLYSGNVGIGNIAPDAPLSFSNRVGSKIALYSSGVNAQYGFGVQGSLLQVYSDVANSDIAFGYGGSTAFTERVRIKGNGNMGIGTSNPARPLSFPATGGEKILLYPGINGEIGIGVYSNELRIHADNAGAKVSFGTQDNAGNFDQTALAQRNGIFAFSVLGNLWVNGTNYASDERFKKNITAIASPLEKLLQLNGVEYEMRTESFPQNHFTPGRQIGLIAQNVEKVIPEAVSEKDGYKGVDYARLVPLLIESIKELKKEIEALKAQVNH